MDVTNYPQENVKNITPEFRLVNIGWCNILQYKSFFFEKVFSLAAYSFTNRSYFPQSNGYL